MTLRLFLVFLGFSILVPTAALPILAGIFPPAWQEFPVRMFWWTGVAYGATSFFTIKRARGPMSFFLSTWFFGSALVITIGTISWLLTVVEWVYAPVFFLGYSVLPALPGLVLAALTGAWIGRLPSMRREFLWFWSGER